MLETHPFKPFVPKNAKYLLLGSFTAKKYEGDTAYDWYYGSKRNQLWRILERVCGVKLEDIKEKQKLFTKLKLAMSDIIYQCERQKGNSLDANLIKCVYNLPIVSKILKENKIEKIFFSSRFVEKGYRKHFKVLIEKYPQIELITLPSPSPRYAAITMEEKIKRYMQLFPFP